MMSGQSDPQSWTTGRVFGRLVGIATVTSGLLAAAAIGLSGIAPAAGAPTTLLTAVVLAWCGSIAAAGIAARVTGRPAAVVATALLLGMCVRLAVTVGLALGFWALAAGLDGDALLIAVGVAQTVLLGVDSAVVLGILRTSNDTLTEPATHPARDADVAGAAELR